MRKEKLITRRREWAEVNVLGYNAEASSAETRIFVCPVNVINSDDGDKKKIKGFINKINNDENFTPINVLGYEVKSELRGISESDFIKYSHPIVSRHNDNTPEE